MDLVSSSYTYVQDLGEDEHKLARGCTGQSNLPITHVSSPRKHMSGKRRDVERTRKPKLGTAGATLQLRCTVLHDFLAQQVASTETFRSRKPNVLHRVIGADKGGNAVPWKNV